MIIKPVKIGNRLVGPGQPCYVIAEIGINHNGDLDVAKQLIQMGVPKLEPIQADRISLKRLKSKPTQ